MKDSCAQNAADEATRLLHECVRQVKVLPEVKVEYMKFEEIVYYREQAAAKATIAQSIFDLLSDLGQIPEDLKEKVLGQEDVNILRKWLKLAARAKSFEEFNQEVKKNEVDKVP